MSKLVGCRVGDYQVLRHLGQGGMADVYAARHLNLKRDVALKVLREDQPHNDDALKRFRREAQAAARLNHPSIVQIYEIGESDGKHFIAQELIDGINLRQSLDRNGTLNTEQACKLLCSACEALHAAHVEGITHRDIKPENIMRRSDDVYKVTDFGLARMLTRVDSSTANLTRDGLTLGTPRYMSPEQIQGQKVDARSDLYSLGVTLYHLLAGSPPFTADEPLALAVAHLHETPEPLDHARGQSDLPAWLVSTVMQLLQKDPSARFQSASEVLQIAQHHIQPIREASAVSSAETVQSDTATTFSPTVTISDVLEPTLGISATTLQLQRVTDAIAKQRQRRWRDRVLLGICLVTSSLVGLAAARPFSRTSIETALRGPIVQRADSVEQQYLVALTRDDEPAWQAVETYFGDQNDPMTVDYRLKAKLQLARMHINQKQFTDAGHLLDEIEQSSDAKRLYGLLAILYRHRIASAQQDTGRMARLKSDAERLIGELKENPQAMQILPQVIEDEDRWILVWL